MAAAVGGFVLFVLRSPEETLTVNLVVRDGVLRVVGADCSGSGPLLYIHRGAAYRIVDAAKGRVLVSGTLPGGTAIEALNTRFKVRRVPTMCRFKLPVPLPVRERYSMVVAGGKPIGFARSEIDPATSSVTVGVP